MRQTHSQHIHKGEKLKVFLLRSGIRQGCSNSPLPFSIVLEVLANTVRQDQKKKKKWCTNQKGRNKITVIC